MPIVDLLGVETWTKKVTLSQSLACSLTPFPLFPPLYPYMSIRIVNKIIFILKCEILTSLDSM